VLYSEIDCRATELHSAVSRGRQSTARVPSGVAGRAPGGTF